MTAWSEPASVETLRKLWAEGLSCSQIAKRIPGTSRNGFIGKANRLGLPSRGGSAGQIASTINGKASRSKGFAFAPSNSLTAKPPQPVVAAAPIVTDHAGKTLADLGARQCHAPRRDSDPGSGRMDRMLYCAAALPADEPSQYCPACCGWMVGAPRTDAQKRADAERAIKMADGRGRKRRAA